MAEDRTKQLGRLGENFFEGQCHDAHLSASPPKYDEKGWDWFVEFPQNRLPAVFLDSQPPPLKCLCQIKSTDDFSSCRLYMKLSNFEHLARTVLPAFVVIYEFRGANAPERAFLCHFGSERIAETLKKIRQLEAQGDVNLHRHSLVLIADPTEEIDIKSPQVLFQRMIQIAGCDALTYSTMKTEWLRTVGFERGAFQFSLKGAVPVSDFIDATLGLSDLKVDGAEISSVRFGIPLGTKNLSAGVLTITPTTPRACDIHWYSGKKSSDRLRMQIAVPPLADLPPELQKARIFNSLLNIIIHKDVINFSASLDEGKKYEVVELATTLKFLVAASKSQLSANFFLDGKSFARVDGVKVDRDRAYEELSKRVAIVSGFLSVVEWRAPVQLSPADFFEQGDDLGLMALCDVGLGASIKYTFDANVEGKIGQSKCLFTSPVSLRLGANEYLTAFVCWEARAVAMGRELTVRSASNCRVWSVERFSTGDEQNFLDKEKEFASFCRQYATDRKLQLLSRHPSEC